MSSLPCDSVQMAENEIQVTVRQVRLMLHALGRNPFTDTRNYFLDTYNDLSYLEWKDLEMKGLAMSWVAPNDVSGDVYFKVTKMGIECLKDLYREYDVPPEPVKFCGECSEGICAEEHEEALRELEEAKERIEELEKKATDLASTLYDLAGELDTF